MNYTDQTGREKPFKSDAYEANTPIRIAAMAYRQNGVKACLDSLSDDVSHVLGYRVDLLEEAQDLP